MAILPIQRVDQQEIEAALDRALADLAPDVVRIRYSLEDDWSGDPAIYFRVVLADDAVPDSKDRKNRQDWEAFARPVYELTKRIRARVLDEIQPDELDLHAYFNFRTVGEQEKLSSPARE